METNQDRKVFRVFVIEDDLITVEIWKRFLAEDRVKLTGDPDRQLEIHEAKCQVEADRVLSEAGEEGFDLVMLDLSYPRDEDPASEDFLGYEWLPKLRETLPGAAIAVITSHVVEGNFRRAVDALLNKGADEFIPKGIKWDELLSRLRGALKHRRVAKELALNARPHLSNVARTSAEDLQLAVSRARGLLHGVELNLRARSPELTAAVRGVFDGLAADIQQVGRRLVGQVRERLEDVDLDQLLREQALRFSAQIGQDIVVRERGGCVMRTYRDDLVNAMTEVLQNAIDAVKESEVLPIEAIWAEIIHDGKSDVATVHVCDKGSGFRAGAYEHRFEPENSHWSRDRYRHKGMGLYVARRMMLAVGGDIEVGAPEPGLGGSVKLKIRDWRPC